MSKKYKRLKKAKLELEKERDKIANDLAVASAVLEREKQLTRQLEDTHKAALEREKYCMQLMEDTHKSDLIVIETLHAEIDRISLMNATDDVERLMAARQTQHVASSPAVDDKVFTGV